VCARHRLLASFCAFDLSQVLSIAACYRCPKNSARQCPTAADGYLRKLLTQIKDQLTENHKQYMRNRRANDIQFKIACNLRSRIAEALKGGTKSDSSKHLLGIEFDTFIKWLEYQLQPGFSIEDMGSKLHADHVIPQASFDLTTSEPSHKVMHWVNHQP
jgi:hypothetical protein